MQVTHKCKCLNELSERDEIAKNSLAWKSSQKKPSNKKKKNFKQEDPSIIIAFQ